MSRASTTGGAQGRLRIAPPSWSVITRSGVRPAPWAAAWSLVVIASRPAASTKFVLYRITPPTWPAAIRARSPGLGVVPSMRTTSFWPTSSAIVGAALGVGAWADVGAPAGAGRDVAGGADADETADGATWARTGMDSAAISPTTRADRPERPRTRTLVTSR